LYLIPNGELTGAGTSLTLAGQLTVSRTARMARAWNRAIYLFYLSSLSWRDSSGTEPRTANFHKTTKHHALLRVSLSVLSSDPQMSLTTTL